MLFVLLVPPETSSLHDELTDAWEKLDASRVVALARKVLQELLDEIEAMVAVAAKDAQPAEERPAMSKERLMKWAERQRELYGLGRLSQERTAKLESIPRWTWER
jgi:hypothetical protein